MHPFPVDVVALLEKAAAQGWADCAPGALLAALLSLPQLPEADARAAYRHAQAAADQASRNKYLIY